MDKFTYEEGDIRIFDCQCEVCLLYNDGARSEECPKELMDKILNNEISCPKKKKEDPFAD